MSPEIPPPLRAAAGLAALTLEEARRLPGRIVSLPVVAIGAAMQASLRFQQEYAGLVARGDEILTHLRGQGDDIPAWAQFDEDDPAASPSVGPRGAGARATMGSAPSAFDLVVQDPDDGAEDPDDPLGPGGTPIVDAVPLPLIGTSRNRPATAAPTRSAASPEPPVAGYDAWTIAQLRARLRTFTPEQLTELLAYERAGRARATYLTMLGNRLAGRRKPS